MEVQGYYTSVITPELSSTSDDEVKIVVQIEIGKPILVTSLNCTLEGNVFDHQQFPELKLSLQKDALFNEDNYQATSEDLKIFWMNKGHYACKVAREAKVSLAKKSADVTFQIKKGPIGKFHSTEITGLHKVKERVVQKKLEWKKGERFSLQPVVLTRQNLQNSRLFSSIKMEPLSMEEPDKVKMQLEVNESKHRRFSISMGYATDEGPRAGISWRHLNFWRKGHFFSTSFKTSRLGQKADLKWNVPHFFNNHQLYKLHFIHDRSEEDLYDSIETILTQAIERKFKKHFTLGFEYTIGHLDFEDVHSSTFTLAPTHTLGKISGPGLSLQYANIDDLIYPKKGLEFFFRLTSSEEGLGGDYSFIKFNFSTKNYIHIGPFVLATFAKLATLKEIDNQQGIPLSERLFAGGDSDVRGYRRHSLGPANSASQAVGGRSILRTSLELRKNIWRSLYGHVFYDWSQISLSTFQFQKGVQDKSLGTGIGFLTSFAMFRLDIGFPIHRDPRHDSFRIHFGIGYVF